MLNKTNYTKLLSCGVITLSAGAPVARGFYGLDEETHHLLNSAQDIAECYAEVSQSGTGVIEEMRSPYVYSGEEQALLTLEQLEQDRKANEAAGYALSLPINHRKLE